MITNEEWKTIEKDLKGIFGRVDFKLGDKKITIAKEFISENKLAYIVYIDGQYSFSWGEPEHENFDCIVEKIWHKNTRSLYKPSEVKKLVKIWGKRRLKKEYPNLEKKIVRYFPWFEKYSVLQRQFKKIKELELWQESLDHDA